MTSGTPKLPARVVLLLTIAAAGVVTAVITLGVPFAIRLWAANRCGGV